MIEKPWPDLLTLSSTLYDLSVSHNLFLKAEMRQLGALGNEELRSGWIVLTSYFETCLLKKSSMMEQILPQTSWMCVWTSASTLLSWRRATGAAFDSRRTDEEAPRTLGKTRSTNCNERAKKTFLLLLYSECTENEKVGTGEGDYNTQRLFGRWVLQSVFGALFRDFSSDGCYSGSLARPNFWELGVIEVALTPPSLKSIFFCFFFQIFKLFQKFSPNLLCYRDLWRTVFFWPTKNYGKFLGAGCYRGLWRAACEVL